MPTYRERLRSEGAALAGFGMVSAAAVLAFGPGATDRPLSTLIQLAVVAVLMATTGVWSVRRSMASSAPDDTDGTGEPTPLRHIAAIVAFLTTAFGFVAGWDAGLRIGGGCVVVGLAQAVLLAGVVAREEARSGRRFHRLAGSSLFTGTKLGVRVDRSLPDGGIAQHHGPSSPPPTGRGA